MFSCPSSPLLLFPHAIKATLQAIDSQELIAYNEPIACRLNQKKSPCNYSDDDVSILQGFKHKRRGRISGVSFVMHEAAYCSSDLKNSELIIPVSIFPTTLIWHFSRTNLKPKPSSWRELERVSLHTLNSQKKVVPGIISCELDFKESAMQSLRLSMDSEQRFTQWPDHKQIWMRW